MMEPGAVIQNTSIVSTTTDMVTPEPGWSSGKQATHQIYALFTTLGIAIVGGAITGMYPHI